LGEKVKTDKTVTEAPAKAAEPTKS
jgi:hypothetical protein